MSVQTAAEMEFSVVQQAACGSGGFIIIKVAELVHVGTLRATLATQQRALR